MLPLLHSYMPAQLSSSCFIMAYGIYKSTHFHQFNLIKIRYCFCKIKYYSFQLIYVQKKYIHSNRMVLPIS